MAGGDTFATSYTLARAIEKTCAGFDLILCGAATSDSETAQVGPQLAEALAIPGVAYVGEIDVAGRTATLRRIADNFLETLGMDLPGLVTLTTGVHAPRYVPLGGLQAAFDAADIATFDAAALGLDPERIGAKGSATRILNVYSPTAKKENCVLTGTPKRVVEELFDRFEDMIGGAIRRDLRADKKGS
jgi:electron transfer flavoprotein beta subunit